MKAPACLLLLAVLALGACAGSEWRELRVREGGFAVLMRGDPFYEKQELDTPFGRMFAHLYSSDRPEAVFAVGYSDYPLAMVLRTPRHELLNGVRDTWVRRIGGRLVRNDATLRLEGAHPGVEFLAAGKAGDVEAFVQARLYLVEQRLYQVVVMGRTREVPQGVVNRFLNSFRQIPEHEVGRIDIRPAPEKKR